MNVQLRLSVLSWEEQIKVWRKATKGEPANEVIERIQLEEKRMEERSKKRGRVEAVVTLEEFHVTDDKHKAGISP